VSADIPRTLEIILRTARDGAEVVRRVQRFSRVGPVSQPTTVDLNEVVREVVELTRPQWYDEAQRRGCRIEVRPDLGVVPWAAGEAGPLREVLINLLLNAIEALPEGGVVIIRTWMAQERVLCAVTDNGIGMSEDTRRRALEPFFTTKGLKSTGLGLSVAYGTIQRFGGTLTIDSAEGDGTTVTVSLSVGVEKKPLQPGADVGPALKGLRVLVIDDEPEVRAILADILASDGHHVLQAAGGREGLELLASGHEVDVVLTDLGMPEMSGSDVARAIQERWPRLPVGLVTGWAEEEVTPEERSRAVFVIQKPFDPMLIREALSGIASPS
jgi:CheY-like chemotaxis protein